LAFPLSEGKEFKIKVLEVLPTGLKEILGCDLVQSASEPETID
jgi:hypothetical protein